MPDILLLEDELCVMSLLRRVLERAGYSVTEARCVEEAKRSVELNPHISLLIADVSPRCSGVRVSVHATASIPGLKVILTSGHPITMWSKQDAALYRELPIDQVEILPKPFIASDVLSIVAFMIGPPAKSLRQGQQSG